MDTSIRVKRRINKTKPKWFGEIKHLKQSVLHFLKTGNKKVYKKREE